MKQFSISQLFIKSIKSINKQEYLSFSTQQSAEKNLLPLSNNHPSSIIPLGFGHPSAIVFLSSLLGHQGK